ncbi:MAG: hypothetical protein WBO17_00025 [Sphingorhabdus sp.]
MPLLGRHWHILLIWLCVSAALIVQGWSEIVMHSGWDPDDQLRLVQLRDFIAGQSWFDTIQYRMNQPSGAPMHWSRMVELPLAFIVMSLRPLVGQSVAEMIATTAVPLLLLGWITIMLARIAERISSREAGVIAALITLSSAALLMQLRPMRIDHHGWQIAMAVLALSTIFWSDSRKAGSILGIALAFWLHISLEGAVMTAGFFLFVGMRWVLDPARAQRLLWTVISFVTASLLLFMSTQARGFYATSFCDTISPPHIWGFLFAAFILVPTIIMRPSDWRLRLGASVIASVGAILIILNLAPQCVGGAFGSMDLLVREYWYSNVHEGLPIWHQSWRTALSLSAGLCCGAASWIFLFRRMKGDGRQRLIIMGFFLLYGLVLSILVIRTISVASAYAIPVTAALIAALFERYRQSKIPAIRLGLVAIMLLFLVPGAVVSTMLQAIPKPADAENPSAVAANASCQSALSVAALTDIPDAYFIAPFDMGPMILAQTPHAVLASSHHRNEQAMHDQIEIFRSAPAHAYRLLTSRGITHLVACKHEAELGLYAKKDPEGLWAMIDNGKIPGWLEPLPDRGKGIKVWRVRYR